MASKKSFAVIGLGQFGISVVEELVGNGMDVIAIDNDEEAVKKVSSLLPTVAVANATDEESLKELGIKDVDSAIVAFGSHIEASILTTVILKELGVKSIVVRVDDPYYLSILKKLGATEVIMPQKAAGIALANRLGNEDFKDFYNAWADGHCQMISTDIPAPFQYNYHTHQIEPSNIATTYSPSMAQMPEGLTNQFHISEEFFKEFKDYSPEYNENIKVGMESIDLHESSISSSDSDMENSRIDDTIQTGYESNDQEDQLLDNTIGEDFPESDSSSNSTDDNNAELPEEDYSISSSESEEDESEEM